ncbi:Nuclear protein DGCR14 [Moelleriella libera RCEF 2490]|uniref:Nuclear protein DGCR14 n=1 Tax=Moelleriella libera RCEF 2490 TaxID=1081109 RepID=A0A167XE43_9HYPO|nr:Nuclear protein DGCR14 [Moelleriella libera RCEF 2490]
MASPTHSTTTILVRKRSDTDLIPAPPPAKKIKRPRRVLDEDSYTEALSHIIARDFFPGLLETEIQQEYLDAVDSKDSAWISSASRRLHHVMTPGRRGKPPPSSQHAKTNLDQGRTPTSFIGDTPASTSASVVPSVPRFDTNMSLTKFQATYTSEDNESFYKLIDKHNQKKADKYAWIWRGNKLPSKQMIKQKEVCDRLAETRSLVDDGFKRDRLAIRDRDERPAQPDSWKAAPRNGLMFEPDLADDVVTVAQRAEEASRMAPRSIEYANTRVPMPHIPSRPPSPTMSSIKHAVAGRPRKEDQDSSVLGGGETPRVNGYSFVDDEEDESEEPKGPVPINLGPGDAHNPFKLLQQRKRELLHERMVDRISKSNKEAARHGLAAKVASPQVPKFASGPRISGDLTPAAQRLWNSMKMPRHKTPGSSFGKSTPMKPRGSLL